MKEKNIDWIIALSLFLVLFLLKLPVLNDPYLWDDNAIFYQSQVYLQNNFKPDLGPYYITGMGIDSGHTPLPYELTAFAFLLGRPLLITHLFWLIFSFIGIFFTYKLGSLLFGRKVGIIASLLLLFYPLYFAQTGILNPDILVGALGVPTLYLFLRKNTVWYLISGSLLVLAKENGFLLIFAILGYIIVRDFTKDKLGMVKNFFIALIPFLVFLGWLFYHWTFSGSFYITQDRAFNQGIELFLRFIAKTYQLFFQNYAWLVSLFVFLSFFHIKRVYKFITKKQFFTLIIVVLAFFIAFIYLDLIITFVSNFISTRSLGELMEKSGVYWVYVTSLLALFFIAVIFRKYLNLGWWKESRLIPFVFMFVLYFAVFTILKYSTPRYLLPLYPFFFIIGARSIAKVWKKYAFIFVVLILILFAFSWYGTRSGQPGYLLEDNMEYRDAIIAQEQMDSYIVQNYPDSIVLTQWPMVNQLRYPEQGFVSKPVTVIDAEHYIESDDGNFNFTMQDAFRYIFYERMNVTVNDIRLYDSVYKSPLTRKDFDLFYYTPESQHQAYYRIAGDFNLTLIKRFEYRGKVAELYA